MHHLEADDLLSGLPWFHNEVKTEFNWVQRRAHSHMCGGGASFNLHCKFKYLASRWSELADTMRQKKEGGLLKQSLWVTTQQCASKSITARRWHSNSETRVPFFFTFSDPTFSVCLKHQLAVWCGKSNSCCKQRRENIICRGTTGGQIPTLAHFCSHDSRHGAKWSSWQWWIVLSLSDIDYSHIISLFFPWSARPDIPPSFFHLHKESTPFRVKSTSEVENKKWGCWDVERREGMQQGTE